MYIWPCGLHVHDPLIPSHFDEIWNDWLRKMQEQFLSNIFMPYLAIIPGSKKIPTDPWNIPQTLNHRFMSRDYSYAVVLIHFCGWWFRWLLHVWLHFRCSLRIWHWGRGWSCWCGPHLSHGIPRCQSLQTTKCGSVKRGATCTISCIRHIFGSLQFLWLKHDCPLWGNCVSQILAARSGENGWSIACLSYMTTYCWSIKNLVKL